MVGSACSVCRARQTTARNVAGDICCVACGGIDGRGRPRTAAAEATEAAAPVVVVTASASGSESGSDDDVESGRCLPRGLSFATAEYAKHASRLPAAYRQMANHWAEVLGFEDLSLWHSFVYFLLLLGSVQATDFFSHSTQEQLQGVFSAALPLHRHLVSSGLAAGVFPAFDTFSRSRPRFAAQMYKRLFGKDRQWSAPKLSAWMLLESIFRYAGEVAIVEQMLFNNDVFPGLHAVMSAGLCHENAVAVAEFLRRAFIRQAGMRTTVRAAFSNRDGRRRTYASTARRSGQNKAAKVEVERIGPDSRFFDNLVALQAWSLHAVTLGPVLLQLLDSVATGVTDVDVLARVMEALVDGFLGLDLLGRPTVWQTISPTERYQCYHAKFLLSDLYYLVATLLCQRGQRLPSGRCDCAPCQVLRHLRKTYMFFGPSPFAFHCALERKSTGDKTVNCRTVAVWRRLRELLEVDLPGPWDLYIVQMLSCTWRVFLATERKHADASELDFSTVSWVSVPRQLVVRVFQLESQRLHDLTQWISYLDLRAEFEMLSGPALHWLVDRVRLYPNLRRDVLLKLLREAAAESVLSST